MIICWADQFWTNYHMLVIHTTCRFALQWNDSFKAQLWENKQFFHAVCPCPHCTGQLRLLSRDDKKVEYSPDPPPWSSSGLFLTASLPEQVYGSEDVRNRTQHKTVGPRRWQGARSHRDWSSVQRSISMFSSPLDKNKQLTCGSAEHITNAWVNFFFSFFASPVGTGNLQMHTYDQELSNHLITMTVNRIT